MDLVDPNGQLRLAKQYFSRSKYEIDNANKILDQEYALLNNIPRCSIGPFFIDRIDIARIGETARERFYDPELLKALSCISHVIALSPGHGQLASVNRVHRWFRNLRRLGGSFNISGFAITATLDSPPSGQSEKLFVIKAPQDPDDRTTVNELFVGIFGLNQLREEIPNFAYLYTGFQCSLPIFEPRSGDVTNWCQRGQNSYYIVYENITPNITVADQLKVMTPGQFLPTYMQILLALRAAKIRCDFTHYDLHFQNVIYRRLSGTVSIPYQTRFGIRYISSDLIATIIDYGRSYIRYQNLGYSDLTKPGTLTRNFSIGDAHRFLCNCMDICQGPNPVLFRALANVLRFFTSMNPIAYLRILAPMNYQIFPTAALGGVGLDDLIDHVLKVSPVDLLFERATTGKVLTCQNNQMCSRSVEGALRSISTPKTTASDIFELVDQIQELERTGREADVKTLLSDPNSAKLYREALVEYQTMSQTIQRDINNLTAVTFTGSTIEYILNWSILEQYVYYVSKMMEIEDHIEQIRFEQVVLTLLGPRMGMPKPEDLVTPIRRAFRPFVDAIIADVAIAKELVKSEQYQIASQKDPRLVWLKNTLPRLPGIIQRI